MYRLLIVDDEPIIVDGLIDFFSTLEQLDLELYWAYSARDAIQILNKNRMDIVLTDIEMPEMSGLELHKEINRQWPRCKVIFLTGYNDFNYIHSSSRNGATDYVLKTEGDAQIVVAVERAISKLEQELAVEQLVRKAESQMSMALPMMQREFLLELLSGSLTLSESTAANLQLREMQIPLDARMPLFMVMGRVDMWREDMGPKDKTLLFYAIHNIAEEYLSDSFHIFHVKMEQDRFVWLLQSRSFDRKDEASSESLSWEKPIRDLTGYIELIQSSCRSYLKLPCSFVRISEPFPWEQIARKYDNLSFLFSRGLGTGTEILLSDQQLLEAFREQNDERLKMRALHMLQEYLDKGQKQEFYKLYYDLMGIVQGSSTSYTGMATEIFYSMVSMFISYINRWGLMNEVAREFNMNKLFNAEKHENWQDTTGQFLDLANALFERRLSENEHQTNEVIRKIHDYITSNLGGDLSLTRLAEIVYLAPSYLSKLYKQVTGQSITDYIIDARVQKARELLIQSPLKIHKIGRSVGFESAAYFARCFKKMTHMTPQEFRDSKRL